jgi:hypothetical protein
MGQSTEDFERPRNIADDVHNFGVVQVPTLIARDIVDFDLGGRRGQRSHMTQPFCFGHHLDIFSILVSTEAKCNDGEMEQKSGIYTRPIQGKPSVASTGLSYSKSVWTVERRQT